MEKFLKPKFFKIIDSSKSEDKNIGRFEIEKLERGFGQTLGTSLRRTIISSIPGAGIFALEIAGVNHEFQAIDNVREDVVEFILNVKKIIFEIDESVVDFDEIYELSLVSKTGIISAKDIELPNGIRIVNPNVVLAESFKDKALTVTFYLTISKGFLTFEQNRIFTKEKLGLKKGLIAIDTLFSPIEKVTFEINDVNPGESKEYERLVFTIHTKGNIKPEKILAYAAEILISYLKVFANLEVVDINNHFTEEIEEEEEDTQLSRTVESLNLSVRSENALKFAGISTVELLVDRPISELQKIKNLGEKSKTEIIQAVQNIGLSFKSD